MNTAEAANVAALEVERMLAEKTQSMMKLPEKYKGGITSQPVSSVVPASSPLVSSVVYDSSPLVSSVVFGCPTSTNCRDDSKS
jgi:hypothetical protein